MLDSPLVGLFEVVSLTPSNNGHVASKGWWLMYEATDAMAYYEGICDEGGYLNYDQEPPGFAEMPPDECRMETAENAEIESLDSKMVGIGRKWGAVRGWRA